MPPEEGWCSAVGVGYYSTPGMLSGSVCVCIYIYHFCGIFDFGTSLVTNRWTRSFSARAVLLCTRATPALRGFVPPPPVLLLARTDPGWAYRGFVPLLLTHSGRRLQASCILCGIGSQHVAASTVLASPSCRRRQQHVPLLSSECAALCIFGSIGKKRRRRSLFRPSLAGNDGLAARPAAMALAHPPSASFHPCVFYGSSNSLRPLLHLPSSPTPASSAAGHGDTLAAATT